MIDYKKNRKDFITVFEKVIIPKYPAARELLNWLDTTDFYTAPASKDHHSAVTGGLCQHSLLVFDNLFDLIDTFKLQLPDTISDAELAIMALCHDLCKIGMYQQTIKPRKHIIDGKVVWEDETVYEIKEDFIFGHGEKSVFILMHYLNQLDERVYQAIRYHMGGIENYVTVDRNASAAMATNSLCVVLHLADMASTYLFE